MRFFASVKLAEVALPLRFPTFDKMRKDEWIIAVEGHEDRYYTGLQVTKDPGVPVVYTGFIIMIIGFWVALFMSHQKIFVEITSSTNSSSIKMFGFANRNRIYFEKQVSKMAEDLIRL